MKHNPIHNSNQFSSVQSLSCVWLFATPCSTPGLPVHHQLPEFTQTHVHWVSDAIQLLILCLPLLILSSVFPSIRVFSNESALHIRWPKNWRFSFSISPSNEYQGLISFRIDWVDLLAVRGTLQESSPTPQFKSINSVLSFFYSTTLTSIHHFSPYISENAIKEPGLSWISGSQTLVCLSSGCYNKYTMDWWVKQY